MFRYLDESFQELTESRVPSEKGEYLYFHAGGRMKNLAQKELMFWVFLQQNRMHCSDRNHCPFSDVKVVFRCSILNLEQFLTLHFWSNFGNDFGMVFLFLNLPSTWLPCTVGFADVSHRFKLRPIFFEAAEHHRSRRSLSTTFMLSFF